jgi:hypothetical protein
MFQILSSKRYGFVPAQNGPGGAATPIGDGSRSDLDRASGFSRGRLMTGYPIRTVAFTPREPNARERHFQQAMALAEQARHWFDGAGRQWRATLPAGAQVAVATESLLVTARLMSVIACHLEPARSAPFEATPPLPVDHPLHGTKGGEIAEASRALVNAFNALA